MLPILKATLSDIKAFAVTTTGKIVIMAVLGTAAAGGTGAAVYNASVQPAQSQARAAAMTTEATNMADSDISSTVSMDSSASTTDVSSMAAVASDTSSAAKSTGNTAIDSAVSAGIQQINSATSKAVSEVQQAASSHSDSPAPGDGYIAPKLDSRYPVINPNTGELVGFGDANYAQFKAELGGDAGTVMPDQSTAITAARAKLKAAAASSSSSSATSK